MNPQSVLIMIAVYFGLLILVSQFTKRNAQKHSFYVGNKDTPWYVIAFGMIGTSISGITFISVPGAVGAGMFGYMQIVIGYMIGYLLVAQILLPLYYRLNLISIYQYLEQRFGKISYKTGASFFLISRLIGASLRLGVVAIVLQKLVFEPLHIPFWVSVLTSVLLIYVYTFQSGVKTVIWTDTIQTVALLAGLVISIVIICQELGWGMGEAISRIAESHYSQVFFFDWHKPNYFLKMILGGAAITLSMTGLDQDMMQKNLACRSLADAQKNMYWFSTTLVFVNLLFLGLGALLYLYATETQVLDIVTTGAKSKFMLLNPEGVAKEIRTDALFPALANERLGVIAAFTFVLGVIAAAYSSADSAMTALTSSFCIDILEFEKRDLPEAQQRKTRYGVHILFALLTFLIILYFYWLNDQSLIDKVLGVAGYTYGPLLGLFAFGIFTRYGVKDRLVPVVCITAPILSYFLQNGIPWGEGVIPLTGSYKFGVEILIVNAILTYIGLWFIKTGEPKLAYPSSVN